MFPGEGPGGRAGGRASSPDDHRPGPRGDLRLHQRQSRRARREGQELPRLRAVPAYTGELALNENWNL